MGSNHPVDVLFICSANRFRSVIAAAYFRSLLSENQMEVNWNVSSAGTWAIKGLSPVQQAIHFAQIQGLKVDDVFSREVNLSILQNADLIIVMSEGQKEALSSEFPDVKERVTLLSEICVGQLYDIPDPVEDVEDTAEELGAEICSLISSGFENICQKAEQFSRKRNKIP